MERALYVLAAAIVVGAVWLGGIYDARTAGGFLYRLNRLTGHVAVCDVKSCIALPNE